MKILPAALIALLALSPIGAFAFSTVTIDTNDPNGNARFQDPDDAAAKHFQQDDRGTGMSFGGSNWSMRSQMTTTPGMTGFGQQGMGQQGMGQQGMGWQQSQPSWPYRSGQ